MINIDETALYNPKLKEAWLEEYMKNSKAKESVIDCTFLPAFKVAKDTEEMLNKDLSSFTLPEILALLRSFGSASFTSVANRASIFRKYTDYCISKNYVFDGQNHYNELVWNHYKSCISTELANVKFYDYDGVKDLLFLLQANARDQYLILAPWEGICGKSFRELIELSLDDLDTDNNIVHLCTGRDVKVSNELMAIIEAAGNTYTYTSTEGNQRRLQQTNRIFKPMNTESAVNVNSAVLTRRMTKIKAAIDAPSIGYHMLKTSGFCYYLAQLVNEKKQNIDELHFAKDQDYLNLIAKYDFVKKSVTEIKYMFNGYIEAFPDLLDKE